MATKSVADEDLIRWGQRTLVEESTAVFTASKRLDQTFARAVKTVLNSSGKVLVTGLGKSGYVARKIAATLTSTGTTACFLHPTEALHGDIGLMLKEDVLIAIAFGGETREVVNVARFARRAGVPIIAISGRSASTLASLATHLIDASVERETCPLNLAPTSSSTVALALGDALAVALMEARGFSYQNFAELHPGGSLGTKLSVVNEYMRPYQSQDFIALNEGFGSILEKVTRHNYGIAPVVDEECGLVGCLSDGDVRRSVLKLEAAVFACTSVDLMSASPKTITSQALAVDAIELMEDNKITALFVVEGRRPVGIVRLHDLLTAKIV